jgi:hypothetical protein
MSGAADITGSVPDVTSMVLGISEAMAPDKGFAYNLCTFQIDLRPEEQNPQTGRQTASMATPSRGSAGTSAATATLPGRATTPVKFQARPGPVIFRVIGGTPGETGGVQSVVEVGIQELAGLESVIGMVELRKLDGFTTGIFDNLAIEVTAQDQSAVPHSVLLVIKGLINPTGKGFAHFIGGVLVRAEQRGAARPSLLAEAQFVTQAPPRSMGAGIFGKVVETYASGNALTLRVYRAPMFSE